MTCRPVSAQDNAAEAEKHTNLGRVAARQGDHDGALKEFEEALRLKPDYALAHFRKGLALYDKGEFEAAVDAYRLAIEFGPDDEQAANYHYDLALALRATQNIEGAIAENRAAKKIDPNRLDIRMNLGSVLCLAERWVEAVTEFSALAQMAPDWNMPRPCYAQALRMTGKKAEGVAVLKTFLRNDPEDSRVLGRLARWQLEDQNWDEAAITQQAYVVSLVISATPIQRSGEYSLLAHIQKKRKRWDEAE